MKNNLQNENTIDKGAILQRLKEISNSASDADLARFLGIAPATLSNWRARGSIDYDLIFSKCEDLNLHWILTGEGPILSSDFFALTPLSDDDSSDILLEHLRDIIKEKDTEIRQLNREIGALEARINMQNQLPAVLRSARTADYVSPTGKRQ